MYCPLRTRTKSGTCRGPSPVFAYAAGPAYLPPCPADIILQKALYYFGPISVSVKSNCPAFLAYSSGIFTPDQDCLPEGVEVTAEVCAQEVDHAMVLVGYGQEEGGRAFWVLKNTWGTTWGEGGYMKMLRGAGGEGGRCGTSCVGVLAITVVQGWSLVPMQDWGKEEGGGGALDKVRSALNNVDKRVLALACLLGALFLFGLLYFCCARRRRTARMAALQMKLDKERARWV